VFLKAAVIAHASGTDYWVDYGEPLTFQGHVYAPLTMGWDGVEASSTMQLPGVRVSVDNVLGKAEAYVTNTEMLGKNLTLQILHRDLLQNPSDVYQIALQVQSLEVSTAAVIVHCGLNLGLQDLWPRGIITKSEFPANIDSIMRTTIV
jgi:hypothetical protein